MPAGATQALGISAARHHQVDSYSLPTKRSVEALPAGQLLDRRELGLAHDHRQIQI
jgi:hypothetical protein